MRSSCSSGVRLRGGTAFVLLLAVIALFAVFAGPALAGDGAIEGTITADFGTYPDNALNDISAYAIPAAYLSGDTTITVPNVGWAAGMGVTDLDGHYTIPELDPGLYYVWFQDSWPPANSWIGQWWFGASPWDPAAGVPGLVSVPAVGNMTARNVDDALTRASHIMGSTGVSEVYVYLYASHQATPTPADFGAFVNDVEAGLIEPAAITGAGGAFDIGLLNPATTEAMHDQRGTEPVDYYLYFADSPVYNDFAPFWYSGNLPPWTSAAGTNPTPVQPPFGGDANIQEVRMQLDAQIQGTVYSWMRSPLEDIMVEAYSPIDQLLADPIHVVYATDWTDGSGRYSLDGLATGDYTIKFTDEMGLYQDEWFSSKPYAVTDDDPPVLMANAVHTTVGTVHGDVDATMGLIPVVTHYWPAWGITNNPDPQHPLNEITIVGWGLNMLNSWPGWLSPDNTPDVFLYKPGGTPVLLYDWSSQVSDDGNVLTAQFDLISNPIPTGVYEIWVDGFDQFDQYTRVWVGYYEVIGFTTPQPPATTVVTPAPPAATPPAPAPAPAPVVTPTPEPVTPVAGAVTVAASPVSVKKGAMARIQYQVNEAVLGGTADVVITISKAGHPVKTLLAKGVKMNSQLTRSFKCNLAKGKYSFTVTASAGGALASSPVSKLTVK